MKRRMAIYMREREIEREERKERNRWEGQREESEEGEEGRNRREIYRGQTEGRSQTGLA